MGKKRKGKARVKIHQNNIDVHLVRQLGCGCNKLYVWEQTRFIPAGYEEMCKKHFEMEVGVFGE